MIHSAAEPVHLRLDAFAYQDVRLLPGLLKQRFDVNRAYLFSLANDSLLLPFRFEALMPTPGRPFGGWEQPLSRVRSHFFGHYLSACARTVASSDDGELLGKANQLVAELAHCQDANGNGYCGGIPERYLSRVEQYGPSDFAWCPYYLIHKTMMGCYEMYKFAGNQQALDILVRMADYIKARVDRLSDTQMAWQLTEEHGGMAHVCYQLYRETGDPRHLALARRWDQQAFLEPLAANDDQLSFLHANTSLPKVYGAAEAYEATGETWYRDAVTNFWSMIWPARSYATGGSNAQELWSEPGQLRKTLVVHGPECSDAFTGCRPANHNQETCTTFNWMWVNRYLLRWTGEPAYADQYERNLYNGIIAAQRPDDGQFTYWMPMAPGTRKVFGTPTESFWCCYGTGVQAFADLASSIYFHDPQDTALYVTLFVPSEVRWQRAGCAEVRIEQQTQYPLRGETQLTVHLAEPQSFTLALRIPWWCRDDVAVLLNGEPLAGPYPASSFYPIERTWQDGDQVQLQMPMHWEFEPLPDAPDLAAALYGPLTMVALADGEVPLKGRRSQPETWITSNQFQHRMPGFPDGARPWGPLRFVARGEGREWQLWPLYALKDEPYTMYLRLAE